MAFPPRNEPLAFRQDLEAKYRDGLRRGPTSTFVDLEGDIVWTQEYLRYRVNGCDHFTAVARVLAQIDGRGIQPVCSSITSPFPPRNEPYDFRIQLEQKYRDGLRRGSTSTYVDIEGDIVWNQEYLRYRVSGCDHFSAEAKVFAQIDGRGIQPDCDSTPPPPPPPPPNASATIRWYSDGTTCSCWIGLIKLRVNGTQMASMRCSDGSRSVAVVPGTYTPSACDDTGCLSSRTVTLAQNERVEIGLTCRNGIRFLDAKPIEFGR